MDDLTKREKVALVCLHGLIAYMGGFCEDPKTEEMNETIKDSYEIADAFLEKSKEENNG